MLSNRLINTKTYREEEREICEKAFRIGDKFYELRLNISTDYSHVYDQTGKKLMSYDSSCNALSVEGKRIGSLSMSYLNHKAHWSYTTTIDGQEVTKEVPGSLPFNCEVELAKLLIEKGII